MTETYTKLFGSIIHSTIWREPDHVRLVWVTMLALADQHGCVWASMPGIADAARVTVPQCEDALSRFQEPDKHSRSKDFDGRRIEVIDRGWHLLNHGAFRALRSAAERAESNAKYQRDFRARKKERKISVSNSQQVSAVSAHAEASASPEASASQSESESTRAFVDFDTKQTAAALKRLHACFGDQHLWDLSSWRSDLAWMAAQPDQDFRAVCDSLLADRWVQSNREKRVNPGHIRKHWAKYRAGRASSVSTAADFHDDPMPAPSK